jgi:hypothetical protein
MRLPNNIKIILLVMIAIGVLALAYYMSYERKKQTSLNLSHNQTSPPVYPTPSSPVTSSPTPTITPEIDISDWNTYQNNEYRFEMKYPIDWIVSPETILSTGTEIEFNKSNNTQVSIRSGLRYSQELGRNYTEKEWVTEIKKSIKKYTSDLKEEIITLNNIPATRLSYKNPKEKLIVNEIYAEKDGILYEIVLQINSSKGRVYNPIFNQMISTFKFI